MFIKSRFAYFMIFLLLLPLIPATHAQRKYPEAEVKTEKKKPSAPVRRAQPKGGKIATTRTNGVLFVLTEPPAATVLVKNSKGAVVKRETSDKDGEFRAELIPGAYDIEVLSANYKPEIKKGIQVRPPEAKIVEADLTPTTGSIEVGPVEPNAIITVDGKRPNPASVVKSGGKVELNNISEGPHTVSITQPDYVDWQGEVNVQGGSTTTVFIKFKEAMTNFVIKSTPGATILIDNTFAGRVPPTGELKVDWKPGQHTISAELDKFKPAVTRPENYVPGQKIIELPLTSIISAGEVLEDFQVGAQSKWESPRVWQFTRGMMAVKSPSTGLLKQHVYDNFTAEFIIKLINSQGASWIVRAQDKRNYYLFQLLTPSGGGGRALFRSFIYRDGVPTLVKEEVVVETLTVPGDQYTIRVAAVGNEIKHFIAINSNPRTDDPQPLSVLPDGSFSYGSIGFASKDGEEFSVHQLIVTPVK